MALSIVPVVTLGILASVISAKQIETSINEEAYEGMHATTLAVKNIFENGVSGEYHLDDNEELWKGDDLNISQSEQIVDQIKETTGMEVTVFFGDTRYLTSLVDESGARQIGTQASEEVVNTVLGQ